MFNLKQLGILLALGLTSSYAIADLSNSPESQTVHVEEIRQNVMYVPVVSHSSARLNGKPAFTAYFNYDSSIILRSETNVRINSGENVVMTAFYSCPGSNNYNENLSQKRIDKTISLLEKQVGKLRSIQRVVSNSCVTNDNIKVEVQLLD